MVQHEKVVITTVPIPFRSYTCVSIATTMAPPRHQSLADLGCLLGAFRDVALGMGLEVMSLTLTPVTSETKPNDSNAHKPFPSGKTRTTLKIMALIETFSDSIYYAGYMISDIDLRHIDIPQSGSRKTWAMRVAFAENCNRDQTSLVQTTTGNGSALWGV